MKNVLHICSNYVGTKIFPNLLYELNKKEDINYLFCPVCFSKEQNSKSYLSMDNPVFGLNADKAKVVPCFSKLDRLLFYKKRKNMFKAIDKRYNLSEFGGIVAHSLFTDGWVAKRISDKYGLPYAVFVQNSDVNYFFKKFFFLRGKANKILKNAKKIIFASPAVRDAVISKYVKDKNDVLSKSVVIPFGVEQTFVDNRVAEPKKLEEGKVINVVTVGTIDRNKNQLFVAETLGSMMPEYNFNYSLYGKNDDEEYFRSIIKNDFVNYGGVKSYKELIEIYRQSDIFILTSQYETFGLVYVEALSQGLPIIYTKGQGFDGQFKEGEVGYTVTFGDAESLRYAIKSVIGNYDALAKNALRAIDKFTWDSVAEQYKAVINDICSD